MITNIFSVKIGSIWNEGQGATFKEKLQVTPDFGPEIKLLEPLQADVMLVRMKDGLTAILESISTVGEFSCTKCLDNFSYAIKISSTERHFYETTPERDYDPFEVFLINKQNMSIDLSETLRQEIILHFPMIPVCSKRCLGLCPGCSINLNHQQKHHKGCQADQLELSEPHSHKPFAHLKQLLQNPKK